MARITTISPTRYMRPCIGFSFSAISVRLHNKNTTGRKVPAPPQEIQPAPPHKRRRGRNCALDCVPKNQPPGSRVLSKGQVAPQSEKGCCDEGARDQCKPGCKQIAGGAAGSVLSGGLADIVRKFQQSGHGDVVNSWVGPGSNKAIAPNDLANALGAERINALTAQTGMSRDELLAGLSEELPQAVDELTPEGRLPNEQGRRVGFRRAGRSGSAGHGAGIRCARPTR